ncbi:MAG: transposase family protein [Ferruginibacter sp.]
MTTNRAQSDYSNIFTKYFQTIQDPRRTSKGNIKYPLVEILFQSISSILCGYSDFQCIEEFGTLQIDWLRKYYPYTNVIGYSKTTDILNII